MRLFVSLTPPDHVLEHLDGALDSVRTMAAPESGKGPPALRWVPDELRHITLAFYGEIPAGAVDELIAGLTLELATHPPLDLRLRGAGVFSSRTLWAGVQDQAPSTHSRRNGPLVDLMIACEQAGRTAGSNLSRHERRRAHLTLARARGRVGADRRHRGGALHRGERGHRGEPGHHRPAAPGAAVQLRQFAEALAVYEGPVWTAGEAHLMRSELGAGPGGGPQHRSLAVLPLTG
ncbi:2'-5' RNA ligase family protein [Nesterenkonia sp. HG001]|uniref:2'-5' RNA ligase family protein n=1 Tax=Nesterenkonia sp. HG001 TaxID=2983207 RepID=UPI002AC37900|nr:2'-5' RNA ligase family protein [Nesterenkonia sp. HG001]MDZ5077071.1 2'-5' RNA ligase family protein [Nesterenkonia sp. HG001]